MKLYRAMIEALDGLPQIGRGARELGVRTGDRAPHNDILAILPNDLVSTTEGLSVAPDDANDLPRHRRPVSLGGLGRDPVWSIEVAELGPLLGFFQDRPRHGLISPRQPLELHLFEEELTKTRLYWVLVTR